ncbi:MAG: VRR-NUC domain-containing protein [Chloroflexi bacterium]|nr:VRR-NUC domain-containing protein [Chloroflexota bacterium]
MIHPTEHDEQKAVVEWAAMVSLRYASLALLYAIPNGGHRHAAVGARLKAEGVKAGIPDLCLPVPRHGYGALYIEMKRVKGGTVSRTQRHWIEALREAGNRVEVCRGATDAIRVLTDYVGGE